VEAAEGARYLGSYRLANLDRFFRRLTSALERGAGSPQTVLRLLRTSVEQGREAEEARPGDAAERAVRVMTIHKSKGLDFDHVYVGQVHKTRRWGELTPSNLGEATRARRVGEVWEYELFGARTPGFDAVVQHEERVEQCERVRLLYVATTRAKERLVIMGRWMERPWPVPVAYARSMVELIASRAGGHPDLLAAMRRLKVSGELAIEEDGARWVFPGLRHDRDEERPRRVDPDASPDLAAIRADRAALHDSRIAAGARMGRRTSVAASESAHRALEDWNGRAPPEAELVRLTPSLRGWLTTDVPQERLEVAVRRATALLEIFARGALGARFSRLADCLVARELPLLAPPSSGPDAPVGYVAGAIDLVYLDPDSGELVVVDYKTDRVPDEAALQDRASAYLLQGRVYAEAVRDALGLGYRPRVELWFLSVDRVISA
jgi:ATP-dependent exoDNAse (exonuclease V) beta subunit